MDYNQTGIDMGLVICIHFIWSMSDYIKYIAFQCRLIYHKFVQDEVSTFFNIDNSCDMLKTPVSDIRRHGATLYIYISVVKYK